MPFLRDIYLEIVRVKTCTVVSPIILRIRAVLRLHGLAGIRISLLPIIVVPS